MSRTKLPHRRAATNVTVQHGANGAEFVVSVGGNYTSAQEVFVAGRSSETLDVAQDGAVLASLALQYGCDLDTLIAAVRRDEAGAPATVIGAMLEAAKLASDQS